MQVLVFCDCGLKTPIHAPCGLGAHFPQKNVTHRPNPKKDRPWAEPRHLSHKAWISAARFELGVRTRKKGQDRKKSQKGYISPISGEAPTEAICFRNCVVGDLLDIITCAKFQNEWFYTATAAALPVISVELYTCAQAAGHFFQATGFVHRTKTNLVDFHSHDGPPCRKVRRMNVASDDTSYPKERATGEWFVAVCWTWHGCCWDECLMKSTAVGLKTADHHRTRKIITNA